MKNPKFDDKYLKEISCHFDIQGELKEIVPFGTGHINDTFAGTYKTSSGIKRYLHQRINHNIFRFPESLMENIGRVNSHIRKKVEARGGDVLREAMNTVPVKDGKSYYKTPDGNYWRTYVFIEGAKTYDIVENKEMVYEASYAFGNFQKEMADLPAPGLTETIPDFHNTRKRFKTFQDALRQDSLNRAVAVKNEIDFVLKREQDAAHIIDLIESGILPLRTTHNDTKLNNVLIDDITQKGICVIDLDTVMPGVPMYDFGDSVRVGASMAIEDEKDLSKVGMDINLFNYLAHGYLDAARGFLIQKEKELLAFSGKLMTFECGMRFLTDHLNGDVYFKVHRENHNLDRCRTQFKMVEDMETKMEEMEKIIVKYSKD